MALACVPLALLPYQLAYAATTGLMLGSLGLAVRWVGQQLEHTRTHILTAAACLFCFYPMFRSVTGGQNTALSVLGLAATWRGLAQDKPWLAGLGAGLMLFKPQFGIPLLGLLLLGREWKALGVGVLVALAQYLVAVPLFGWAWPAWWVDQIGRFHLQDQATNAANSVGFLGTAEAILGPGSPVALAIGGGLTVLTVGFLSGIWLKRWPLNLRMALSATGILLVSPHAMFYDAGLAVLTLLAIAGHRGRAVAGPLLLLGCASWLGLLNGLLGFNPLLLVLLGSVALLSSFGRSSWDPPAAPGGSAPGAP